MIYLLDEVKPEFFKFKDGLPFLVFHMWETTEARVRTWIENERVRSIFSKQEIRNLFRINRYIQMVQVPEIVLETYDKLIYWTQDGRYFVIEVINLYKEKYEERKNNNITFGSRSSLRKNKSQQEDSEAGLEVEPGIEEEIFGDQIQSEAGA